MYGADADMDTPVCIPTEDRGNEEPLPTDEDMYIDVLQVLPEVGISCGSDPLIAISKSE